MEKLYSAQEIPTILPTLPIIPKQTLYHYAKAKGVKGVKIGKDWKYTETQLRIILSLKTN